MSNFKKGDKVLVDAVVREVYEPSGSLLVTTDEGQKSCDTLYVFASGSHPRPGVSVAALLDEIERLWDAVDTDDSRYMSQQIAFARTLRADREAANEPKLKEGQRVWVKALYKSRCPEDGSHFIELRGHDNLGGLPSDDIRTEEPPEKEIM